MRIWDVLALLAIVVLATAGLLSREQPRAGDGANPRRPDPSLFEPPPSPPDAAERLLPRLPPASSVDPVLRIETKRREKSGGGTAFSIDPSGVWVTARHVTDGCDRVLLRRGDRYTNVERIEQRADADISILWTRGGIVSLPLARPDLRVGQDGFSFGYPRGQPGDVYGTVIGRRQVRHYGGRDTVEPAIAWAQIRRVPDIGPDLRGISGGPWVDRGGHVIGVHIAGAPRRGRSYSTAPDRLLAAVGRAGGRGRGATVSIAPDSRNFPNIGERLRRQFTVSQVVCLFGERWRRKTHGL